MTAQQLTIGFIPLLDCATLVAAAECGFASAEGLELRLVPETSWANIRDRIIVGQFDAAHMLGPMAVASSLGIGHVQVPMVAPVALGLGGNAITVSSRLREAMRARGCGEDLDPRGQGAALRAVVRERALEGADPLVLAMVYPFSCHNYELRYWLAANGIDPDHDVRLVVIPPPLLADALREEQVDGFCVGEPWSSVAVATGIGHIVTTGMHIWPRSPEKVLGVRRDWADAHADTLSALVRAIVRAAHWCDDSANRVELARLLSGPRYVGVPAELLDLPLSMRLRLRADTDPVPAPDFIRFARDNANFPWPSHAQWFYRQMVRWKQLAPSSEAVAVAAATYRPDLYRAAVAPLSLELPPVDMKSERFFDDSQFVPAHESSAVP
jgi:NitT/TauT family transport system ATP-binding protein